MAAPLLYGMHSHKQTHINLQGSMSHKQTPQIPFLRESRRMV